MNDTIRDILAAIVESARECEECDGTGRQPRSDNDACHNCGGTGEYAIVSTIQDIRAALNTSSPPAHLIDGIDFLAPIRKVLDEIHAQEAEDAQRRLDPGTGMGQALLKIARGRCV